MGKLLLLALAVTGGCQSPTQTKPASSLGDFAAHLESLRARGHIQALSAVISKEQSIAWSGSFGGTDAVPGNVGDTTVFHLASLTKPLASTVILQLVDEGKVSLDAGPKRPMRHAVEIRHQSFVDPAFIDLLRRHDVALVCADMRAYAFRRPFAAVAVFVQGEHRVPSFAQRPST